MTAWARRLGLAVGVVGLLSGCKSVGEISGVVTGAATGGATASPAIGFVVGIATNAAVDELVEYIGRVRAGAEQDNIAAAAGALAVGQSAPWHIHHTIPIGDEHGTLWVTRVIATPWTTCKEVVFAVEEGRGAKLRRHFYATDICLQAKGWKWAEAEPAVPRWGYLQ